MQQIRLPRGEWWYDPTASLGPEGGFGAVFAGGRAAGDRSVAVKRLKLSARDAAHRELRIANELAGQAFEHVVPILDAGLDAELDSYFVIMARATRSLQDELRSGKRFNDAEAIDVLGQIAKGLAEVPTIIHRDLKPANVLLHDGRWKVADFGIARFVEETTSLHTLKECLSPPYAAPEQWRMERATTATDIYALGCIGFVLLTGGPPFPGPSPADYHEQHVQASPPVLEAHDPRLRSRSAARSRPRALLAR